jgi:hypothetical protein
VEGPTRRGLSGILALCALFACAAGVVQAAKSKPSQAGTFALIAGNATSVAALRTTVSNGALNVKVKQFQPDAKTVILNYDMDMTRPGHFFIVRDDFATFEALNPDQDVTTGTLLKTVTDLDPAHRYYLYADTIPTGMTQQGFRFVLQGDVPAAAATAASIGASTPTVTVGQYTITADTVTLAANTPAKFKMTVRENGKVSGTIQPYLGADGHVVLVNTRTLAYANLYVLPQGIGETKAMQAAQGGNPQSGPYMQVSLPALPAGTYKMWLQFRGSATKIFTAPFTIVVQ